MAIGKETRMATLTVSLARKKAKARSHVVDITLANTCTVLFAPPLLENRNILLLKGENMRIGGVQYQEKMEMILRCQNLLLTPKMMSITRIKEEPRAPSKDY